MKTDDAAALVPMNDLKRRFAALQHDVEQAVLDVLRSGWWLMGSNTSRFADAFAEHVGAKHCVPVANGTDALEIALRAIVDVRRPSGREVITVANAGGYTSIACRSLALTPVYVDVEEHSQLLSIESVIGALSHETAAVVATHLYGGVVDVIALRAAIVAAGFGHVAIIEDCAQAHDARLGSAIAGTMGDLATFSFYPTKNLGAFGDAGAVITSDDAIGAAVRRLHQYGWVSKYNIGVAGGRNSRIDETQAAALSVLLPYLRGWNAKRQDIIARYRAIKSDKLTFVEGGAGAVGHLAVALTDDRDGARRFFETRKIATDIHYPILDCDQSGWSGLPVRIAPSGLPVSRRSVARIMSVPCFPEMRDDEINRVCDAIGDW